MTLHITNAYHATSGGISTFYRALLAYANKHRREMRLIVPAAESSVERVGKHAAIYHVASRNSPVADTRYRLLWPFGSSGAEIRAILRAEQPDLVEISDKYTLPMLAGFLRKGWIRGIHKRPLLVAISHERMDDTANAYFGFSGLWRSISRLYMKQYYFPMFDAHIANSAYTVEELVPASKGHRLHRDIRVLPMGVDADSLTPVARTAEAQVALAHRVGIPEGARALLYVGRLATEKNLPMLVEMMNELPSAFYLVLGGTGPLEPWLKAQGGRIRLVGHLQRQEISRFYAGAGAFVHANSKEPFGIAPLEAMAAGLPLVAPNAGGVLSYATPLNAWLAEPTPIAFASAVRSLFEDEDERHARAARARQVAVAHNWPGIAARYFAQFDAWIAEKDRWK